MKFFPKKSRRFASLAEEIEIGNAEDKENG
jgi:hypothetical protein